MDKIEAQGRLLNHLRLSGFEEMKTEWAWEHQGHPTNIYYYSLPLYRTGARLLLHPGPSKSWSGMIAFRVGTVGELGVVGGKVERKERQSWKVPRFSGFRNHLDQIEAQVRRWELMRDRDLMTMALLDLADDFTMTAGRDRTRRVIRAIRAGEFSAATAAEGYSLAYDLFIRSLDERLLISNIWRRVFR